MCLGLRIKQFEKPFMQKPWNLQPWTFTLEHFFVFYKCDQRQNNAVSLRMVPVTSHVAHMNTQYSPCTVILKLGHTISRTALTDAYRSL